MVNFSKASSWVLESSASTREVCVYGKGDPRHVLYLRASQVVVFLHRSWKIVAFGDNTAPQHERLAPQRQSTPHSPTMELRAWEDILTKERSIPKKTATTKEKKQPKLQIASNFARFRLRRSSCGLFLHWMSSPKVTSCGEKRAEEKKSAGRCKVFPSRTLFFLRFSSDPASILANSFIIRAPRTLQALHTAHPQQ